MLSKQNFFITLAKGISTKEDPKQVIPGRLLTLENATFISPNELKKRNGYSSLSLNTETTFTFNYLDIVPTKMESGNFLAAFNQEIILNDNFNLFSYSAGLNSWVYKQPNTICKTSVIPIIRNTNSQSVPDSAINPAGLQVFAWEDSADSNVHAAILDTKTNQIVVANQVLIPSGAGHTIKPKCTFINGNLIIFYLDTSVSMRLYYVIYNGGVFTAPVLVVSDVDVTFNNYDIKASEVHLYVTYNTNADTIRTLQYLPNLSAFSSITQAGENADNCINLFIDLLGNVWIPYANSTQAKLIIFNNDLTLNILAPTLISTTSNIFNITGTIDETNKAWIFFDVLGSADSEGFFSNAHILAFHVLITGAIPGGQQLFLKSACLQSKAFSVADIEGHLIPHVVVSHDANLQPTYFLCNLFNTTASASFPAANIAAKIAESIAGGPPAKASSLSAINILSPDIFQTAALQKDLLFTSVSTTGTVNTYSQLGVISPLMDFTQINPNTIVLGNNLHIGSGMLSMYDGASVVEHNFHLYPEAITAVINAGAGNLTPGTYGYQITYEWTDNAGQLHRSAPSPILSEVVVAANNTIDLTIPTLRITAKTNVTIVIYRTQANGTVYFRLNLPTSPLFNNTTTDTVSYHDNNADSAIGANEQLYTTGGEVPNIAAPGSVIISEYKNRVILIPSDNPYSWWFSKQVIPGSPVEFSNAFVENIGTDGGPITAMLQMDSNAIFFKENSIFYVVGDGPSPSGANNDFTQALSIASDVGCINSQSLVLMPMGIIFKSNKGIYLLSRGLAVQYIGADVEAFNNFPVTSAQLISYTNQIRFTLQSGVALVYDYFVSQWSVFTNITAISSIITADTFSYLHPTGKVLQETKGQFTDDGRPVVLKLTTSWLSLSGIQGFQRIYKALILGQYFGPHQLSVQFAYDFDPANLQQTYINATQLLNSPIFGGDPTFGINSPFGGSYPTYQWRVFTERQVCQTIQITIQDVPFIGIYTNVQGQQVSAGYNESLSLSSISLELGIKKGLNKLPGSRSFG